MSPLPSSLRYLAEALRVKRCHTEPVHYAQSVGEHSCGVAVLCAWLTPEPSATLLLAALTHDLGERRWGDVPGHVKVEVEALRVLDTLEERTLMAHGLAPSAQRSYQDQLTAEEARVLGLADKLDLLLYCCVERAQGNRLVRLMYTNTLALMKKFEPLSTEGAGILTAVQLMWRQYDQ